jgi:hypothetical protein
MLKVTQVFLSLLQRRECESPGTVSKQAVIEMLHDSDKGD